MQKPQHIIAIDIAKQTLEVATSDGQTFPLSNDARGFASLRKRARRHGGVLVVFEATGGYERPLFENLHAHGVPSVIINPRRLRAFAKSEGMKAKSDPIDAGMILRFAQEKDLRVTAAPSPEQRELADLLERRSQLCAFLAQEKNRMQKAQQPARSVRGSQRRVATMMEKELERIETAIRALVGAHRSLAAPVGLITSVRGVGEVTAWTLVAYLREIGELTRNQLAALVGVAPFDDDSGQHTGRRYIQGGRAKVRRALYMAAHSAATCNPVIAPYVAGLRARGKPYKCALVAAMRKLIIHIQSLLKSHGISLAA